MSTLDKMTVYRKLLPCARYHNFRFTDNEIRLFETDFHILLDIIQTTNIHVISFSDIKDIIEKGDYILIILSSGYYYGLSKKSPKRFYRYLLDSASIR